jgi:tRNA(Met) cytidine acetyltransferase
MSARRRRCVVLRGTHEETRQQAIARTGDVAPGEVLWVAPDAPEGTRVVSPRALDAMLGQEVDAVVLDLHGALDPDAIARAEGLIRAGGALVLRMSPIGTQPVRRGELAVHPFTLADVATRMATRFERLLPPSDERAAGPVQHATEATHEQDEAVAQLAAVFADDGPCVVTLLADRGRGKSAALGRALRRARETAPALRVALTAPSREAAREVFRFGGSDLAFLEPLALAHAPPELDVIVIDEAAQLPVALVKRIVLAHPKARIALATTCRGYEGTGRGFTLRLLAWLRSRSLRVIERTLAEPIRWDAGDPLERWAFDALLLDAEPAVLAGAVRPPRHVVLDRDRLASEEPLLRQLFGLLVQAHYRTTPSDLARVLDAPNLDVHALLEGDDIVAASLVAREGGLPSELAEAMLRGRTRISGHALPDTLVSHALRSEVAGLSMIRSVRIAVHERRRRRGLARDLVESVHASYAPDLFGTIFGATAELVRFRQSLGYEVVRLGVARGARSGEPAVVMARPVSEPARQAVAALRHDLAVELDAQLALMASDDGAPIDTALRDALTHALPSAAVRSAAEHLVIARGYAASTQPIDVVAGTLAVFARENASAFARLDERARTLMIARLHEHASWREVARRAGLNGVPAAMRAMRESVVALVRLVDGG